MGHEDAFPPTTLSDCFRSGKPTSAGAATCASIDADDSLRRDGR